jgi:hypothetical protein
LMDPVKLLLSLYKTMEVKLLKIGRDLDRLIYEISKMIVNFFTLNLLLYIIFLTLLTSILFIKQIKFQFILFYLHFY